MNSINHQNPNNIIFVKVGTKYSHEHVNALYNQLIKHYPASKFWCYTDNYIGIDNNIHAIVPINSLKKWWAKLSLFSDKMPFEGTCLFFDLDVVVKESINQYIKNYDTLTILNAYWKKDLSFEEHDYNVKINSSIITWTAGQQRYVFDHFMSNKDYFMRKYVGIDRLIEHEKIEYSCFDDGIVNTMQLNDRVAPVNIYNGMNYDPSSACL